MKAAQGTYATLIGDLIGSRQTANRAGLQGAVRDALTRVNEVLSPRVVQPLEPTVGDEFQGVFVDVSSAVRAGLLLRLQLLREWEVDSRYGLGFGDIAVFEERTPVSQDGAGWWCARSAIEDAKGLGDSPQLAFVRTRFSAPGGIERMSRGQVATVNAMLVYRDALIARMRPRSRRLLLGMLLERPQSVLATEEKISQSAVSQNLVASGAYAVMIADDELRGVL
jgi:hypothetical protein